MIVVAAAIFLFFIMHEALEGIVCATGDRNRRKFLWDMFWTGAFVVLYLVLWIFMAADIAFRQQWGGWVFFTTPVAFITTFFLAVRCRAEFERGTYARTHPLEHPAEVPHPKPRKS